MFCIRSLQQERCTGVATTPNPVTSGRLHPGCLPSRSRPDNFHVSPHRRVAPLIIRNLRAGRLALAWPGLWRIPKKEFKLGEE
jgi:hypothetical protein